MPGEPSPQHGRGGRRWTSASLGPTFPTVFVPGKPGPQTDPILINSKDPAPEPWPALEGGPAAVASCATLPDGTPTPSSHCATTWRCCASMQVCVGQGTIMQLLPSPGSQGVTFRKSGLAASARPARAPPSAHLVVLALQSWTAQNLWGFFCLREPPSSARKADGLCSLPRMGQQVKPSWPPPARWLDVLPPPLVSGHSGT